MKFIAVAIVVTSIVVCSFLAEMPAINLDSKTVEFWKIERLIALALFGFFIASSNRKSDE